MDQSTVALDHTYVGSSANSVISQQGKYKKCISFHLQLENGSWMVNVRRMLLATWFLKNPLC